MALGGGIFTAQNKVLPGSYINFVSLAAANSALSDRGIATMPFELDWGIENEVFEVTSADFRKNSLKLFGYSYNHEKMKGLRDLFRNITTLYAYRLNGSGTKAENDYAVAKFSGIRGNDLKIVIQRNVDNNEMFDVKTMLDNAVVDVQTVSSAQELTANEYITFKEFELAETAGTPLKGGENGTTDGAAHQSYLDKIEAYSFNAMGVASTEDTIKTMYVNFCKRLRDEIGAKFQTVVYDCAADYEGVINVKNRVLDTDYSEAGLVYWVTGIAAGCAVNKSNLNKTYDGEFSVDVSYTQAQLENAIKFGEFALHKVGNDVRVLEDINSLVTVTDTKGVIFKDNQTIRVVDQIANDIAVLFNTKYLGTVPNDAAGRISLWADIVKHHEQLQDIRAIEEFSDADVTVTQGNDKKSVVVNDAVTVVNAMSKLYMTVTVA